MATSETITGTQSGSKPYLSIYWTRTAVDISNNRSKIKATLRLHAPYTVRFSAPKNGVLQGSSFRYTAGASGTGRWNLRTREFWVGHNSDGTKSQSLSGHFDINVTYSGSWLGRLSVSGTAHLDPIPRNSDLTSFSIANSFKPGTANTVNLGIKRNYASYTHTINLRYGGKNISRWSGIGTPNTLTITAEEVNDLLKQATTTTRPQLELVMSTRDGSNNVIGRIVRRNTTGTISSTVIPTITNFKITQAGSGLDKISSLYVQSVTRVSGDYNASPGYGATITNMDIAVRKSDGSNNQVITTKKSTGAGISGTTRSAVSSSGSYYARAYVRDSRGATNTQDITFTVTNYTEPTINSFTVRRRENDGTKVDTSTKGKWTNLGNKNSLTLTIKRKKSADNFYTNIDTENYNLSTGSFTHNFLNQDVSESNSFDYQVEIKDQFGKVSIAEISIGTAKTVLDINKNLGVGIGKRHERGELDVAGDVYFEGDIELQPKPGEDRPGFRIISQDNTGHGYIEFFGPDLKRRAYIGIPSATTADLNIYHEAGHDIKLQGKEIRFNNQIIVNSGSNSNGHWIQFYDGTMICRGVVRNVTTDTGKTNLWTYPKEFVDTPSAFVEGQRTGRSGVASYLNIIYSSYLRFKFMSVESGDFSGMDAYLMAIGRWK